MKFLLLIEILAQNNQMTIYLWSQKEKFRAIFGEPRGVAVDLPFLPNVTGWRSLRWCSPKQRLRNISRFCVGVAVLLYQVLVLMEEKNRVSASQQYLESFVCILIKQFTAAVGCIVPHVQ